MYDIHILGEFIKLSERERERERMEEIRCEVKIQIRVWLVREFVVYPGKLSVQPFAANAKTNLLIHDSR